MVKTMEESHEPQLPVVSAQAPPPVSPFQPAPINIVAPVKRPGRWLVFRRTMRLLFRRWLYAMTIVFRTLRPFSGFVVVIVALLGVIGWMGVQLWWPTASVPNDVRVAALPPAPSVEHYIQGQQTFDANLMWEALSPKYQANQLEQGISKATLQAQVDKERSQGFQYSHYDYVGGIKLDNGGNMYFYAVDVALQSQHLKVPYTYIADTDGKIVYIMAPKLSGGDN
jgi:hypothetical protein